MSKTQVFKGGCFCGAVARRDDIPMAGFELGWIEASR